MAKSRDYKAEYARRLARAKAAGKTRQQARGHKPGEAKQRKQRERETFGISSSEVQSVKRWYDRFNGMGYKDIPTLEDVIDFARDKGYDAFKVYRDTWDQARRTYLKELRSGTYASRGDPYLEMLTEMAGVSPPGSTEWLYYH